MTPPATPIDGGEPGLFEFTAEVALFIAAILLTLLVVGFVAGLIVSIRIWTVDGMSLTIRRAAFPARRRWPLAAEPSC